MVLKKGQVVLVDFRIGTNQRHAVDKRLADEHPVERVFVVRWEIRQKEGCLLGEGQGIDAVADAGSTCGLGSSGAAGFSLKARFPLRVSPRFREDR